MEAVTGIGSTVKGCMVGFFNTMVVDDVAMSRRSPGCIRARRTDQSINQSNLIFVKRRLNKVLRGACLHKEPSLKARLELFATNITDNYKEQNYHQCKRPRPHKVHAK